MAADPIIEAYLTKVEADLNAIIEWETNNQLLSVYGTMK